MPERIQLRRVKGWRLPPNAVSVARPTRWGNPFAIGAKLSFPFDEIYGPVVRDRAHAVEIFATYASITSGYELLVRRNLAGKSLACWCPLPAEGEPDICHAAVLLSLANKVVSDGTMPCPVPSDSGVPCVKRIPEGWTADEGHGGGHCWMSPETEQALERGHYDATAALAGQPFTIHQPEDCTPACPQYGERKREDGHAH